MGGGGEQTEEEIEEKRKKIAMRMEDAELDRIIKSAEYFHGYLPRADAVQLLVHEGDFLVREAAVENKAEIVISILWKRSCRHFRVQVDYRGYFCVDGTFCFNSIQDLIQHYWFHNTKITKTSKALLLRPVGRQWWEHWDDNYVMQEELGSGVFGKVNLGLMARNDKEELEQVAIKTSTGQSPESKERFLREARNMRGLSHPNVCHFIGVCALEHPLTMLLGYADIGNLFDYLRSAEKKRKKRGTRTISPLQLIRFGLDAAKGLEYIGQQGIIHMDIAARNCLVKTDKKAVKTKDEEYMLQIADFGLSRKCKQYKLQENEAVSRRWSAPELLQNKPATTQSDVWSFGILLWEIFSDGRLPYPEVQNDMIIDMYLVEGNRMATPPTALPRLENRCKIAGH